MVERRLAAESWRVAWGKAPAPEPGERPLWSPLHVHLTDSGEIARRIWREWVGAGVRAVIARDAGGDEIVAGRIVELAASLHDIGKLSCAFAGQVGEMRTQMEDAGFRWPDGAVEEDRKVLPHTLAGHIVLLRYLTGRGIPKDNASAFAVIVGSHHGVPPNDSEIRAAATSIHLGIAEWDDARAGLMAHVIDALGLEPAVDALMTVRLSDASQLLITAIVIMADWIASSANLFPLAPRFEEMREPSARRAEQAWRTLDLPRPWQPTDEAVAADATDLLRSRFAVEHEANQVQRLALESARAMQEPGLLLIEAVMGAGKTEASLLAAEVLAWKFGRSGIFYGLPTRATADAMFHRVLGWWQNVPDASGAVPVRGVSLRHSTALLNDEFQALRPRGGRRGSQMADAGVLTGLRPSDVGRDIDDAAGPRGWRHVAAAAASVIAHYWTSGRKQASFADTTIATIDHQLLAALTSRHVMLRHLGLARQVVILDEVHSADTWMEVYLERALEWLARYDVPVIVLSATLPPERRRALVEAYERGRRAGRRAGQALPTAETSGGLMRTRPSAAPPMPAVPDSDEYPLVTALSGGEIHQMSAEPPAGGDVHIQWLLDSDEAIVAVLDSLVSAGGCALVVCNTVRRAVARYRHLRDLWGAESVTLAHSRFVAHDRIAGDTSLRDTFGPGDSKDRAGRIVVATQVAEQSLDIDFDLLITDLAPVDLVLQRIGRLHRHHRPERPGPGQVATCYIAAMATLPSDETPPAVDRGGASIYSEHLLLRSAALLDEYAREERSLRLPDDVPPLVRSCYGGEPLGPAAWQSTMMQARHAFDKEAVKTARDAATYSLRQPGSEPQITGILLANVGEAETNTGMIKQVRQADGGFEVIVLRQDPDGLCLLKSFGDDRIIPTDVRPSPEEAKLLARSIVRVPGWVTNNPRDMDEVMDDLSRRYYPAWQKDPLIARQLILVLDTDGEGTMGPFDVRYSSEFGLEVERG